MSKRSEIIEHIKTILTDADLIDGPIHDSQTKAYALDELPCALVLIQREMAEVFSESTLELKKTAELSIQVIGEHTDGAELEIHDVLSEIERALLMDDSLGNLVSRVKPDSIEIATFLQGERPIIAGTVKVHVHYFELIFGNEESHPLDSINLDLEEAYGI